MSRTRSIIRWTIALVASLTSVQALEAPLFAQSTSLVADLTSQAHRRAEQGDILGARSRLAEAFKLDPTYGPAWIELGRIHERAGDTAEALRVYQAGIDRVPSFVEGYRARTRLLERLGRIDEASLDLRAALSLAPADLSVRTEGLEFYIRRRAWSAALQQSRAVQVLLEARSDAGAAGQARVRTLALEMLAAESDPVWDGTRRWGWERRAIAAIGRRLGAL
ncbi:MAG: tetratricopeptide repeat protein [Deltaproteobacteria bacterium]|nr:tetratricopeptide repeat protein [Deltaproteobacteria bacterium]